MDGDCILDHPDVAVRDILSVCASAKSLPAVFDAEWTEVTDGDSQKEKKARRNVLQTCSITAPCRLIRTL